DYTLTIHSGPTAFSARDGRALDGDGNGSAGGDYQATLTFGPLPSKIVSMPDFARGAGQSNINVPNTQTDGLPLYLNNSAGVQSVQVDIIYDPTLINFTGAFASPQAQAAGFAAAFNPAAATPSTPAGHQRARVVLFGAGTLAAFANFPFVNLVASIP